MDSHALDAAMPPPRQPNWRGARPTQIPWWEHRHRGCLAWRHDSGARRDVRPDGPRGHPRPRAGTGGGRARGLRWDSSTTRWCCSAAGPRASAGPPPCSWPEGASVAVGDVALEGPGHRRGDHCLGRPGPGRGVRRPPRGVRRRLRRTRRHDVRRHRLPGSQRRLVPPAPRYRCRRHRPRDLVTGSWRPTPGAPCSWPATPSPT